MIFVDMRVTCLFLPYILCSSYYGIPQLEPQARTSRSAEQSAMLRRTGTDCQTLNGFAKQFLRELSQVT